jgi:hypothetical protein
MEKAGEFFPVLKFDELSKDETSRVVVSGVDFRLRFHSISSDHPVPWHLLLRSMDVSVLFCLATLSWSSWNDSHQRFATTLSHKIVLTNRHSGYLNGPSLTERVPGVHQFPRICCVCIAANLFDPAIYHNSIYVVRSHNEQASASHQGSCAMHSLRRSPYLF